MCPNEAKGRAMKGLWLLAVGLLLLIGASALSATPGVAPPAQNLATTAACGLGQYWVVDGGGWQSVWLSRGGGAFLSQGAFWMQDDTSADLTIALNGSSVVVESVNHPNVWGTLKCTYTGTVRPDGVSVVGTSTCELTSGVSTALSWSAQIVCDAPLLTWSDTAFWYRAAKGSQFDFQCPPGGFAAPIWGTGVYIEGSSICAAAVHAGAITLADGGLVTIEILPGEASYPGSSANGITSETFATAGQFDASFRVVNGTQPATPVPTPTVEGAVTYPDMFGPWQSGYGPMVIEPNRAVYGSTANDPRSFISFNVIDAYNIEGYWIQPTGSAVNCNVEREGSNYWGRFRATFEPGYARFNGQWAYCDLEPAEGWAGWR
jgi:hypothetical protein